MFTINNNPGLKLSFRHWRDNKFRRCTTASILALGNDDKGNFTEIRDVISSISRCSRKDIFSKREGRVRSLINLVGLIGTMTRNENLVIDILTTDVVIKWFEDYLKNGKDKEVKEQVEKIIKRKEYV